MIKFCTQTPLCFLSPCLQRKVTSCTSAQPLLNLVNARFWRVVGFSPNLELSVCSSSSITAEQLTMSSTSGYESTRRRTPVVEWSSSRVSQVINLYHSENRNSYVSLCVTVNINNLSVVFTGGVMGSWELHNINLNVTQKSRVVFEGVRGNSPSTGGFSLDDINLSSSKCPQHIWHIRNITHLMATTPEGRKLYSPRFLSPAGYSFQVMSDSFLILLSFEHSCLSHSQHHVYSNSWFKVIFSILNSLVCRWVCTSMEEVTVQATWGPTSTWPQAPMITNSSGPVLGKWQQWPWWISSLMSGSRWTCIEWSLQTLTRCPLMVRGDLFSSVLLTISGTPSDFAQLLWYLQKYMQMDQIYITRIF